MNQLIIFRAIVLLLIAYLLNGCVPEPPKLNCKTDIKELEEKIRTIFSADSVKIVSIVLKEEIYFPTLIAPEVSIYNPETKTLNFKLLDENEYHRFENYQKVEEDLKVELEPIAILISESCELAKFNDIIIKFAKSNKHDKYKYGFISHFEYLVN